MVQDVRPGAPGVGRGTRAGAAFTSATHRAVRRLPFGLSRIVAPSFLGFALINGSTFGVDLALLTLLHGTLHWPLPLAVTTAYATAFAIAFVLNRVLNFRSRAHAGPQVAVYALVVVANYLVWVLGANTAFVALGVDYRIARLLAGACEAAFMYLGMRRIVFRDVAD